MAAICYAVYRRYRKGVGHRGRLEAMITEHEPCPDTRFGGSQLVRLYEVLLMTESMTRKLQCNQTKLPSKTVQFLQQLFHGFSSMNHG